MREPLEYLREYSNLKNKVVYVPLPEFRVP